MEYKYLSLDINSTFTSQSAWDEIKPKVLQFTETTMIGIVFVLFPRLLCSYYKCVTQGNQYEADLRAIDLSRFINRHRNIHEAMYHILSHDDDKGRGRLGT